MVKKGNGEVLIIKQIWSVLKYQQKIMGIVYTGKCMKRNSKNN